ncbi:calcium-binding protein CP1-like [Aristolochia californica]|uniref:calcium-binding protein CP1-like n=1 Tax=Aristolochia californica TaxID=171875 RepID=UPI0035E36DD8
MCPSGRCPRLETSVLLPAFDVLDSDRDGKISADDLKTFYSERANAATEDDIGSMITVADVNKNGYVEFDEFEMVVGERKLSSSSTPRKAVMEEMFKVMDRDGDGKVGFGDLKDYMAWAGFETSDEDIRTMIRMGDGNEKDGGVCYEGLMKILAVDFSA